MYEEIKDQRSEILKQLQLFKDRATKQQALSVLGNIYYRKCRLLPAFLGRYSSPQLIEEKTKKYISDKLRCPNCKKRVVDYFKKYVKNT